MNYDKMFCFNIEAIENFEKAKADNFKGWLIHHRLETHTSDGERRLVDLSMEELKALDMYYMRPASELIFMKTNEHNSLYKKGKKLSEEHKQKLYYSRLGRKHSEETKMSEAHKRSWELKKNGKEK